VCFVAVAGFRNTGLERGAALAKDIAWMQAQARKKAQRSAVQRSAAQRSAAQRSTLTTRTC
jgi:hypothetical protein